MFKFHIPLCLAFCLSLAFSSAHAGPSPQQKLQESLVEEELLDEAAAEAEYCEQILVSSPLETMGLRILRPVELSGLDENSLKALSRKDRKAILAMAEDGVFEQWSMLPIGKTLGKNPESAQDDAGEKLPYVKLSDQDASGKIHFILEGREISLTLTKSEPAKSPYREAAIVADSAPVKKTEPVIKKKWSKLKRAVVGGALVSSLGLAAGTFHYNYEVVASDGISMQEKFRVNSTETLEDFEKSLAKTPQKDRLEYINKTEARSNRSVSLIAGKYLTLDQLYIYLRSKNYSERLNSIEGFLQVHYGDISSSQLIQLLNASGYRGESFFKSHLAPPVVQHISSHLQTISFAELAELSNDINRPQYLDFLKKYIQLHSQQKVLEDAVRHMSNRPSPKRAGLAQEFAEAAPTLDYKSVQILIQNGDLKTEANFSQANVVLEKYIRQPQVLNSLSAGDLFALTQGMPKTAYAASYAAHASANMKKLTYPEISHFLKELGETSAETPKLADQYFSQNISTISSSEVLALHKLGGNDELFLNYLLKQGPQASMSELQQFSLASRSQGTKDRLMSYYQTLHSAR